MPLESAFPPADSRSLQEKGFCELGQLSRFQWHLFRGDVVCAQPIEAKSGILAWIYREYFPESSKNAFGALAAQFPTKGGGGS
jgi:hypothetical protein